MRDHEPSNHAAFDDSLGAARPAFPSCDEQELENKYERPSMRNIDIHERPTLVP